MSSHDTWLNVLTGISQGSFDKIYLKDASGNMVDLLTLLGTLGGGITDVISQSSELQLPGKLTQVFEDCMAKGHIWGFNVFVTNRSQKIDLAAILGGN